MNLQYAKIMAELTDRAAVAGDVTYWDAAQCIIELRDALPTSDVPAFTKYLNSHNIQTRYLD